MQSLRYSIGDYLISDSCLSANVCQESRGRGILFESPQRRYWTLFFFFSRWVVKHPQQTVALKTDWHPIWLPCILTTNLPGSQTNNGTMNALNAKCQQKVKESSVGAQKQQDWPFRQEWHHWEPLEGALPWNDKRSEEIKTKIYWVHPALRRNWVRFSNKEQSLCDFNSFQWAYLSKSVWICWAQAWLFKSTGFSGSNNCASKQTWCSFGLQHVKGATFQSLSGQACVKRFVLEMTWLQRTIIQYSSSKAPFESSGLWKFVQTFGCVDLCTFNICFSHFCSRGKWALVAQKILFSIGLFCPAHVPIFAGLTKSPLGWRTVWRITTAISSSTSTPPMIGVVWTWQIWVESDVFLDTTCAEIHKFCPDPDEALLTEIFRVFVLTLIAVVDHFGSGWTNWNDKIYRVKSSKQDSQKVPFCLFFDCAYARTSEGKVRLWEICSQGAVFLPACPGSTPPAKRVLTNDCTSGLSTWWNVKVEILSFCINLTEYRNRNETRNLIPLPNCAR